MYYKGRSQPLKKLCKPFIVITLFLFAGLFSSSFGVNGQSSDNNSAQVHLTSSFILWHPSEKMIDNNFTVHIITYSNISQPYSIMINEVTYTGNVTYYAQHTINVSSSFFRLTVTVNGTQILIADKVTVLNSVTGAQITRGRSVFTINLMPSEWDKKEWSIFTALFTSLIIILPISYRGVKKGRKVRGIKEIR